MNLIMEPRKVGACLKAQVRATLIAVDGTRFIGTNGIMREVGACPRATLPSFVGYAPCKDVCKQPSHAEVSAILLAGEQAEGATIYLEGHHAPCPDCVAAANAAGVAQIIVSAPPA